MFLVHCESRYHLISPILVQGKRLISELNRVADHNGSSMFTVAQMKDIAKVIKTRSWNMYVFWGKERGSLAQNPHHTNLLQWMVRMSYQSFILFLGLEPFNSHSQIILPLAKLIVLIFT